MKSVVAITGSGGWPLNVFLTPSLEPFFGGTYFPPTPRYGMPEFFQRYPEHRAILEIRSEEIGRLCRGIEELPY